MVVIFDIDYLLFSISKLFILEISIELLAHASSSSSSSFQGHMIGLLVRGGEDLNPFGYH